MCNFSSVVKVGKQMKIGQKIKQLRKELEMSVDDLAKATGKDRSTIYRYESGEIESIPVAVLDPIARALGVNLRELLGWQDADNIIGVTVADEQYYTTSAFDWNDAEREIIQKCAQYIITAKDAADYEDKLKFLSMFFDQLNK